MFSDLMGQEQKEASMQEEFNKACTLSYKSRMYGFGIFFAVGGILTIIAAFMVPGLVSGHPERFAIPYAFGAICTLASTMFLMGPWKQVKSMFDKKRWMATTCYLLSIVLTLVMALAVGIVGLVLMAIILQLLCLFWYSISYIPYARTAICNCCKSTFSI